MKKDGAYKTAKHQQFFSHGGIIWGLVKDFKDFIFGDDNSNHNFDDNTTKWGEVG
jgi:hypothetical protein